MSAPPAVASHRLAAPTVADARKVVEQGGAGDSGLWARLCEQARVPATAPSLNLEQLDALVKVITTVPGILGVLGRSLAVRLSSYRTLTLLNGPGARNGASR
jgi:hypothetical protein